MKASAAEDEKARALLKEYSRLASVYDRRWASYIDITVGATLRCLSLDPFESLLDAGLRDWGLP